MTRESAGEHADLVERHFDLVKRIAGKLIGKLPSTVQLDDLIQAGAMGLLEASRQYDSERGASFETFAGIRIRGAMLDEVRRQNWAPRSSQQNMRRINAAKQAVENREGRQAVSAEIATQLGIDLETYHRMLDRSTEKRVFNVDEIGGAGVQDQSLVPDSFRGPASDYEHQSLGAAISSAIKTLPAIDKTVLSLYYVEEMNLREIGEVFGVTETRTSQIRSRALARLRARLVEWQREDTSDKLR